MLDKVNYLYAERTSEDDESWTSQGRVDFFEKRAGNQRVRAITRLHLGVSKN